jgi:hypothetical protein
MNLNGRLARLEDSPQLCEIEKERNSLRLMQLIAIGTLRLKGLTVVSVAQLSETELLDIIGTNKRGYEQALSGFVTQRRKEAHA